MRFRPLMRPLKAPRRARAIATLSLMTLVVAVAMASVGQIPLRGALVALGMSAALALIALIMAGYGLRRIWSDTGNGTLDAILAGVWALPVLVSVGLLTYVVTQTPSYPDIATNVNNPPDFTAFAAPSGQGLPLDGASPADRIRISLANPELETLFVERPGWHVAEVIGGLVQANGWEAARIETVSSQTSELEFSVPGSLPLVDHSIAIRIVDNGEGALIDARALSNIPLHDFGTNAPVLRGVLEQVMLAIEATPPPISDL